jgi:acyl-CoA synthetase (AMP-forming)/AMP-acid ligase II
LERSEETAKRIVDGWVLTGDIGRFDKNGYLYVLDRAGDMIISGGYNIYPAELENVLSDHAEVIEAAVFAIPSEKWGESPMAVCVAAEGANVEEGELIQLCIDRLGSYKRPARVQLTTEPLPKSMVGKIMRKSCASRSGKAGNAASATPELSTGPSRFHLELREVSNIIVAKW